MLAPLLVAVCCTIGGNVHAATGGLIPGASVVLEGGAPARVTTDARGNFSLVAPPGHYRLAASAKGFATVVVAVDADRDIPVQIALEPADSPRLRRIGQVTVDGRLAPARGAIPAVTLTRADFERLGEDRLVQGLATAPGATFSRPDGGAASAVTVVSLRGPDPSESLVALDGQLLNDGNTGDLDLSQIPVAALSAVDVTEGLGPQDINGSNTFGGAVDLVSLRPTTEDHVAGSLSGGSFGTSQAWLNATGSRGRFGYAAAFDDRHQAGYVAATVPVYSTADPRCAPCATRLGSSIASHVAYATFSWSFAPAADVTARVFILGDVRDQSAAINGIDARTADAQTPAFGGFTGPGNQTFAQTIRAYQVRARFPVGAGEANADVSRSVDGVDVAGGNASPYDLVHTDRRDNVALTWQRDFDRGQFAIGGSARGETLTFVAPPAAAAAPPGSAERHPELGRNVDTLFVRGGVTPVAKLRLDAGLFQTRDSTFGADLDGRFGAVYTLDPATALRFSLGTGFRAPLLAERYRYPYAQLTLDANGVFVGQGSAAERPEHATEYELGAAHEFSHAASLDLALYRTNLRDPIEVFYPLAAVAAGTCRDNTYAAPIPACVSFNSNVGNAVYTGAELRYVQRLFGRHVVVTSAYGLNVAYPSGLDAPFANPTSGGDLVNGRQFAGIPQQQGSLEADWTNGTWHAATVAIFRGTNNELNLAPFTTVNLSAGKHLDAHVDVSLAATNLFDAGAGRFTVFGGGIPYRGIVGQSPGGAPIFGDLPTDAEHVEPFGVRAVLTIRR